jgi:general secretion pathway protein A
MDLDDSWTIAEQEDVCEAAPAPFAAPFAAPVIEELPTSATPVEVEADEPVYAAFDAVAPSADMWDDQQVDEAPATEEPVALEPAPEPIATIDAAQVEGLRADMLAEIEALRAEISSLRAVQAHVPFTPAQTVDPEALKDCFTLIEERLQSLEFRAEEQDTALRRVLTLLVDWVEREEQMASPRDSVAA